jgi:hypothetical protein
LVFSDGRAVFAHEMLNSTPVNLTPEIIEHIDDYEFENTEMTVAVVPLGLESPYPGPMRGCFTNGYIEPDDDEYEFFYESEYDDSHPDYSEQGPDTAYTPLVAAKRLLGVLTLLNEKLALEHTIEPDEFTAARIARQRRQGYIVDRPPRTVLTLNVPTVRYAVSRSGRIGAHESPCLHWRRGHQRVLHRGSEFEKTAWVRRCLVGDPDKGFVGKSYRLVHQMPMLGIEGA